MVKLSVIVPVYNKAKYLDACIQSILNQTFTDFELILVNDGSTDGSDLICENYSAKDSRVILINQNNAGVSAARNAGISRASGQYLGFIDSDDTIEPDMYQLLYGNAVKHDADISVCRMRLFINGKILFPPAGEEVQVLNHHEGLKACLSGDLDRSANNKIYKYSVVKEVRFEGRMYEDILYTCKTFVAANKTVVQNLAKYNYLVRDSSVSMSGFGLKYMETVNVSAQMVKIVGDNDVAAVPYAQAFDVLANISLLNLILLAKKDKYKDEYQQVKNRLNLYSDFVNLPYVRKKHRYAYKIFNFWPTGYSWLMYLYCKVTQADAIGRV